MKWYYSEVLEITCQIFRTPPKKMQAAVRTSFAANLEDKNKTDLLPMSFSDICGTWKTKLG